MEPVIFVIPPEPYAILTPVSKDVIGRLEDCKAQGLVNAGSLVSFTEKLSKQNKEDVLNSTLFAQLAATKKYDRCNDAKQWYDFYTLVMSKIGWNMQQFQFSEYKSHSSSLDISKVVVELLLTLVGDEDSVLIDVVQKTLDALDKSVDKARQFVRNSSNPDHANFQIVTCTLDKNGQVKAAFLACVFSASHAGDGNLFTWRSSSIKLMKSTGIFTLNGQIYGKVRDEIIKKLGDSPLQPHQFIQNLDI